MPLEFLLRRVSLAGLKRQSSDPAPIASGLLGLPLAFLGLWLTANSFGEPISIYDEGLLLSGANSILHGGLPLRDFYSNYPPGIFMLIAGIWWLFGVSVMSTRALGFMLHVFVALLGGRLAARCVGLRFSWLAFGLILAWLVGLKVQPFAWIAALAMALLFIELFRLGALHGKPIIWLTVGFAWGTLLAFRQDLFCFFNAILFVLLALFIALRRVRHKEWPAQVSRSVVLSFVAGAVLATLIFWSAVLMTTPASRIVGDLLIEQLRIAPARVLPLPLLFEIRDSALFGFPGPAFSAGALEGAVLLELIAPALAALLWLRGIWFAVRDRTAVLMLGALAIAVLPQMMGRTDETHALYTIAPALILGSIVAEGLAQRISSAAFKCVPILALGLTFILPVRSTLQSFDASNRPRIRKGTGQRSWLPEQSPERREVLAFIETYSKPDEAVFIGTLQHRVVFINEVDLYFLADRVGATRYTQFDPNLVNRADIQREMVADLERRRTRVVVLSACCMFSREPNESSRAGAGLLDLYLGSHYRLIKAIGGYLLLLRNDSASGG